MFKFANELFSKFINDIAIYPKIREILFFHHRCKTIIKFKIFSVILTVNLTHSDYNGRSSYREIDTKNRDKSAFFRRRQVGLCD